MTLGSGEQQLRPKLAIIAGPNGSGKSTFYREFVEPRFPLFVNADQIADEHNLSSAAAASSATSMREALIAQRKTFAFETVFSRTPYWVNFLLGAAAAGYEIHLFFLCTEDPGLNVRRVETRVEAGGHPVSPDKILRRYPGSIQTAIAARALVDELWLYDNTAFGLSPRLIGHLVKGRIAEISQSIPQWAVALFMDARLQ